MPGTNGCFGYALQGNVTLHNISDKDFRVVLDFPLVIASPLGFQGECEPEVVRKQLDATVRELSELKGNDQ